MAYATAAELKTYLSISGSGDDTLLGELLDRATAMIDRYTNRTFAAAGDTTRYFTVDADTEGRMLWFDTDICSITTVKTNNDAASPTTIASTEYVTMPRNRTPYYGIKLLWSSDNEWTYTDDPEMGIEVTGKWAYSTTAPDDIAQACIRLAAFLYRQKDAQLADVTAIEVGVVVRTPALPADVKMLLEGYRRL